MSDHDHCGIQIPLFNRNQGNVQASKLELERSQQEIERIKLALMQGAQPLLQKYATDKLQAERYRTQMIPRAQRAYELYLQKYRNMAAAYTEVIISQRTFFQLQESYAQTLGELWTTAVQLQNYLLAGGLSAPKPAHKAICRPAVREVPSEGASTLDHHSGPCPNHRRRQLSRSNK